MFPFRMIGLAAAFFVLSIGSAHAYVDPGSGTFLIQILFAGLVGVMFFFRQTMARIRRFFGGKPEEQKNDDTPTDS